LPSGASGSWNQAGKAFFTSAQSMRSTRYGPASSPPIMTSPAGEPSSK